VVGKVARGGPAADLLQQETAADQGKMSVMPTQHAPAEAHTYDVNAYISSLRPERSAARHRDWELGGAPQTQHAHNNALLPSTAVTTVMNGSATLFRQQFSPQNQCKGREHAVVVATVYVDRGTNAKVNVYSYSCSEQRQQCRTAAPPICR
jgi:hypothetical protein